MAANTGRTMAIKYTGKLDDGTIFDSNVDGDPLEFVVGVGQVIPGMDKAVENLSVGDMVTVAIPPEEAYGEDQPGPIEYFPTDLFADGQIPQVGQVVMAQTNEGDIAYGITRGISMRGVELEMKHPLAGQNLNFEIEVVDLRDTPEAPAPASAEVDETEGESEE